MVLRSNPEKKKVPQKIVEEEVEWKRQIEVSLLFITF